MRTFLIILLLLFSAVCLNAQVKAFPSAEGGGSNSIGGRGGVVVKVTNRNTTGAGSLYAALIMTVPRIIVFDVSGIFPLPFQVNLTDANSNFTLAGQTAPAGGVTITGFPIFFTNAAGNSGGTGRCTNIIIRHVRFRNGTYTGVGDVFAHNAIVAYGINNFIIDHSSFSFNDDQAISFAAFWEGIENITVQRSLFSENATGNIMGGPGTFPTNNISHLYNAWVHNSHRHPNVGSNSRQDIINNVSFNWQFRNVNLASGDPDVNFIGNYHRRGSFSSAGIENVVQTSTSQLYTANNYHATLYPTPQLDDRNLWTNFSGGGSVDASRFTTTRHALLANTPEPMTAIEAYNSIIGTSPSTSDVGSNRYMNSDGEPAYYQDSYDVEKINDVLTSTSRDPFNKTWVQPTLPNNSRLASFDTDSDGMSDAWETREFGNLSQTASGDFDADGYTNIEEYINQVDGVTPPTVTPPTVQAAKKKIAW